MVGVVAVYGDSGVRLPRIENSHALLSFVFLTSIFSSNFSKYEFSLSIVAVLVSVRHLEVDVKINRPLRSAKARKIYARALDRPFHLNWPEPVLFG